MISISLFLLFAQVAVALFNPLSSYVGPISSAIGNDWLDGNTVDWKHIAEEQGKKYAVKACIKVCKAKACPPAVLYMETTDVGEKVRSLGLDFTWACKKYFCGSDFMDTKCGQAVQKIIGGVKSIAGSVGNVVRKKTLSWMQSMAVDPSTTTCPQFKQTLKSSTESEIGGVVDVSIPQDQCTSLVGRRRLAVLNVEAEITTAASSAKKIQLIKAKVEHSGYAKSLMSKMLMKDSSLRGLTVSAPSNVTTSSTSTVVPKSVIFTWASEVGLGWLALGVGLSCCFCYCCYAVMAVICDKKLESQVNDVNKRGPEQVA